MSRVEDLSGSAVVEELPFKGGEKYNTVVALGKELFAKSNVVRSGIVSPEDVGLARRFVEGASLFLNPESSDFFRVRTSGTAQIGRNFAVGYLKSTGWCTDYTRVEFLGLLEGVGRVVEPNDDFASERARNRMLSEMGIPKNVLSSFPSLEKVAQLGAKLGVSGEDIGGGRLLTGEQKSGIYDFFVGMSPEKRILNVASYLVNNGVNENYYPKFPTPERGNPEVGKEGDLKRDKIIQAVQGYIVNLTMRWLGDEGVDRRRALKGFGDEIFPEVI
ncbi:MAG: hypothetical protein C4584_02845 [Armatimonadetes bacterium]|nr:MAG: hypothetical protein C4584_02845 [Armatimonadota bacterium]